MDDILVAGAWLILAYLLGSINFAVLVVGGSVYGGGSGNPGTVNTLRVAGWRGGALVLLLDVGRAVGVALAALSLFPFPPWSLVVSLALLLGNILPLFHRFRGGKGVALAIGTFLALEPLLALMGLAIWVMVYGLTRKASLGSCLMVLAYAPLACLFGHGLAVILPTALLSALVLLRHASNIRRILHGEELPLGPP